MFICFIFISVISCRKRFPSYTDFAFLFFLCDNVFDNALDNVSDYVFFYSYCSHLSISFHNHFAASISSAFLISIFILPHSTDIRHFPKSKSLEILILCLLLFLLPGVSLNVYERTISGLTLHPAYAQAILKRWKHET